MRLISRERPSKIIGMKNLQALTQQETAASGRTQCVANEAGVVVATNAKRARWGKARWCVEEKLLDVERGRRVWVAAQRPARC